MHTEESLRATRAYSLMIWSDYGPTGHGLVPSTFLVKNVDRAIGRLVCFCTLEVLLLCVMEVCPIVFGLEVVSF